VCLSSIGVALDCIGCECCACLVPVLCLCLCFYFSATAANVSCWLMLYEMKLNDYNFSYFKRDNGVWGEIA